MSFKRANKIMKNLAAFWELKTFWVTGNGIVYQSFIALTHAIMLSAKGIYCHNDIASYSWMVFAHNFLIKIS